MNLSRRAVVLIFAVVWFAGIAAIIAAGFEVDGYQLYYRHIPLPHPYPLGGVIAMCGVVTVETTLLYALSALRVRAHERMRLWLASFLALLLLFVLGSGINHAPPYMRWHALWLIVFLVVLVSLALSEASASVLRKVTG